MRTRWVRVQLASRIMLGPTGLTLLHVCFAHADVVNRHGRCVTSPGPERAPSLARSSALCSGESLHVETKRRPELRVFGGLTHHFGSVDPPFRARPSTWVRRTSTMQLRIESPSQGQQMFCVRFGEDWAPGSLIGPLSRRRDSGGQRRLSLAVIIDL